MLSYYTLKPLIVPCFLHGNAAWLHTSLSQIAVIDMHTFTDIDEPTKQILKSRDKYCKGDSENTQTTFTMKCQVNGS